MQCVYNLNQGVVTDLMGNRVENYVGFSDLYFFREGDDYVTDIFGNRRELGFGGWIKHTARSVGGGIEKTATTVGKTAVESGKEIGKAAVSTAKGIKTTAYGVGDITKGAVTGDSKEILKGLKDTGKGALSTGGGALDILGKTAGGVVKTGVSGASTAAGETLKGVGAKDAGKFLESDKFQRAANLGVNLALLAVPGVGEAELAAEGAEAAELAEGVSTAAKAVEESGAALEEASSATKAAEEAQAAAKTEEEAAAAEKQVEEAKAAEKEAQEAHEANIKKAEQAEEDAAKQSKIKMKKTRQALKNKYVKMGLEGAALDSAVDVAINDFILKGLPAPDKPSVSKPEDDKKGTPTWVYILLVLAIIVLGVILYNFFA